MGHDRSLTDKRREQPHVISDRIARRITANRLRASLGRKPIPVTPSPEYPVKL